MNVGQDTTLSDRDVTQELVQFFVISDGELQMTGNDSRLLIVASGIAGKLEDLSCKVFQDGSQVDRGTGTDSLSVISFSQETMYTANWERKTGFR